MLSHLTQDAVGEVLPAPHRQRRANQVCVIRPGGANGAQRLVVVAQRVPVHGLRRVRIPRQQQVRGISQAVHATVAANIDRMLSSLILHELVSEAAVPHIDNWPPGPRRIRQLAACSLQKWYCAVGVKLPDLWLLLGGRRVRGMGLAGRVLASRLVRGMMPGKALSSDSFSGTWSLYQLPPALVPSVPSDLLPEIPIDRYGGSSAGVGPAVLCRVGNAPGDGVAVLMWLVPSTPEQVQAIRHSAQRIELVSCRRRRHQWPHPSGHTVRLQELSCW